MALHNARVLALLTAQDYIGSRDQLLRAGMSRHAIENCFAYDGWQRLLPRVYLAHPGEPSRRQRMIAALLYAGPDAAIDADDAAVFHGVRAIQVDDEIVRIVAPQQAAARSHRFVRVRRTSAPFATVATGCIRYVDAATAVVAAARRRTSDRAVLALLADAVQRRIVTVAALEHAHRMAAPRNVGPTDRALAHLQAGIRSTGEGDFRALAEASTVLPPLHYNARLLLPSGRLVSPDALAVDAGLVHETNGRSAHERDDLFSDMQERHDAMTEAGLIVLHNAPWRLQRQGRLVISQFERVYLRHAGRGLPPRVVLLPIAA